MGPTQHTVSAFVRSAVRGLRTAMRERVLQSVQMAPALLPRAGGAAGRGLLARCGWRWHASWTTKLFGLDTRRMKVGSFALLCHAAVGQTSVERAMRQTLSFSLFFDDISATLVAGGREARIELDNRIHAAIDEPDARRFADETLLVMLHGLLCWLAARPGCRWRGWSSAIHSRPMPTNTGACSRPTCDSTGPSRPLPSTPRCCARAGVGERGQPEGLPARRAAIGVPQAGGLGRLGRAGAPAPAACLVGGSRDALVVPAEAQLLDRMAADFDISPATLRRRLEGEGTHWQQLKDEVRRDLALVHLADRRLSVEQVAAMLGFNDGPSFHRAFRKWTGSAPGAFRPTHVGRGAASGFS